MKDPIADLIIRLKNAGIAKKPSIVLTYSKLKMAILDVLVKEGFVKSAVKKGKKVIKYIEVTLDYHTDGTPKISGTERVSKTSKRVYLPVKLIRPVRNGFGLLVLSTPKGVMSGKDAIKEKVGGEALFKIW
jgi:small subunit ribosomal protein S8